MLFDYAVSALLTLFVVVDPVGLTPIFLAVTDGLPRTARRIVAVRASIIAGAILAGSALIGDWLLQTLQISLSAFRIAGGLLLFSIASEMVFGVRIRRDSEAAEQAARPMRSGRRAQHWSQQLPVAVVGWMNSSLIQQRVPTASRSAKTAACERST